MGIVGISFLKILAEKRQSKYNLKILVYPFSMSPFKPLTFVVTGILMTLKYTKLTLSFQGAGECWLTYIKDGR